jgi:hypothetical protein
MVPQGLDLELATMQNIASALAELEPAARVRTLHWLRQRFDDDMTPAPHATAAPATVSPLRIVPTPSAPADDTLSIETLSDLFDRRQAPEPEAAAKPVSALLTEFVAEFQDLAREWDGACDPPAEARRSARLLYAAS